MQITSSNIRDGLYVDYRDARGGVMSALHAHTHIEIFFCLSDGIGCLIGDQMFTVNTFDVVLFDAGRPHRTFVPPDAVYRRYTLSFYPAELLRFAPGCVELFDLFSERSISHITPLRGDPECARFLTTFERIYRNRDEPGARGRLQRFSCLLDILLLLAERKPSPAGTAAASPVSLHEAILPVLTYLNEGYRERITLDNLCERFYMSRSRLTRAFRAATGLSIGEYIKGLRVVQAKNLLIQGKNLPDVAHECGFGSVSQFIRAFGEETGFSPKQFAKYNHFFEDAYRYGRH